MAKRVIVAIDGPAGAGKSSVAKTLAARLGFIHIDTGAMYRCVALWAMRTGVSDDDFHKLEQLALGADIRFEAGTPQRVLLNGEDVTDEIRVPHMGDRTSRVSQTPGVRRALIAKQRAMGETASVVMEGRDIGTAVFPDAEVKIFLDAALDVRIGRRKAELLEKGVAFDEAELAGDMAERDRRDRGEHGGLRQAPDADLVDSSELNLDEVVEQILKTVRARTSNGKEYAR
ncbi:MAG: (d)CMP kinase [Bryobacteraceae bacterium]|nr:(d)CMP kinase [Bryobacteraceae bacterium]